MNVVVNKINTKTFKFSNWCYLIEDPDSSSAILIDPAWEFDVFEQILKEHNTKVEAIFLTHSHFDHTNLVNKFVKEYNTKVYISREEREYYQYNCKNLNVLNDNQIVTIHGIKVQCFLTPGHTKGSMCYLIEDNLFTGDTVFNEGCGWCSGNGASPTDMYYSIKHIKNYFPPETKVFPSHIYCRPVGQTLNYIIDHNIYFNLNEMDDFVNFRTRKGQKNLFKFI